MVTKSEILTRGLQETIESRVRRREIEEQQRKIKQEQRRVQEEISKQQEEVSEQQEQVSQQEVQKKALEKARKEFEEGPQFRVVSVDSDRRGKVKSTVFTAKTREEAEKLAGEARGALGRDVSVGIERIEFGEAPTREVIVGPPKSERGLRLKRGREELESISQDVSITDGQIDVSGLTPSQKARVKQLTGIKAEEAFTIETKPTFVEQTKDVTIPTQVGKIKEAEKIALEASKGITAKEILTSFRKLPKEFQTPETLKSISEVSEQRQLEKLPLTMLGKPIKLTTEEIRPFVAASMGIEKIKEREAKAPTLTSIGLLEVIPKKEQVLKIKEVSLGKDGIESRISREPDRSGDTSIRSSQLESLAKKTSQETSFRRETEKIERAEKASAKGFKRVEQLASIITGGKGKTIEQRSFVGQVAEKFTTFLLSPIPFFVETSIQAKKVGVFAGGTVIFPESRKEAKRQLLKEAPIGSGEAILQMVDVTKPSGLATFLTAGVVALPSAISATRSTKAKKATVELKGEVITPKVKERLPSLLVRVREVSAKIEARGLKKDFREEGILTQKPIFGKPELIDVRTIETPELVLVEAKGKKVTEVISERAGKEKELAPLKKVTKEEVIEGFDVLTPKQAKEFQIPRVAKLGVAREFSPIKTTIRGDVNLFFQPLKFTTSVPTRRVKPTTTGPGRRKRLDFQKPLRQVGFQPKLTRDVFIQLIEKRGGELVAIEVRKTPSGIKKTVIKEEVPQVFAKDPFGFGKKKIEEPSKKIIKSPEPKTTESGGILQILEPPKLIQKLKQDVKQKVKVEVKQEVKQEVAQASKQEGKSRQEALQELGLKFGKKKKQGIFIIEEVIAKPTTLADVLSSRAALFGEGIGAIPSQAVAQKVSLVQEQIPIQQVATAPSQLSLQSQVLGVSQTPAVSQAVAVSPAQAVIVSPAQAVAVSPAQAVIVSPAQAVAVSQAAAQRVSLISQLNTTTLTETVLERPIQKKIKTRIPRIIPRFKPKKRVDKEAPIDIPDAPSYNIQVRKGEKRGSKFQTIEKNLPRNVAIRRLTSILDNYIEASGRLKASKKRPKVADDFIKPILTKFRGPKKGSRLPRGTVIERRRHRLDTSNEIKQISFFRQLQAKKKQLRQRIMQRKQQTPRRITTFNLFTKSKKKGSVNILKVKKSKNKKMRFL